MESSKSLRSSQRRSLNANGGQPSDEMPAKSQNQAAKAMEAGEGSSSPDKDKRVTRLTKRSSSALSNAGNF
jgi:hypothetical protein